MTTGSGVHALPGKDRTNLTIMLIISYGQFGFNSSGGLPAAEMALEDINNKPDLLPGYNLVYDPVRDSQVCVLTRLYIPCTLYCYIDCLASSYILNT